MDPRQNTLVTMTFMREQIAVVPDKDQWRFEPKGRWARIQRWAWALLMKTGALSNGVMDKVSYTPIRFRSDTVLGKLMETRGAMFENLRKPTRVLIGPDVMEEITCDPAFRDCSNFNQSFTFTAPMNVGHPPARPGDRPRLEVYGVKITVIPWMRGMVVLDDEWLFNR
jgi:hypothetical protein